MRTDFTAEQLADPDIAQSEKILRNCTHCGFCTATCPTYLLLGDELDGPRGRIYLIKNMLADDGEIAAGYGQAHRPLPLLPLLHDDLPVRGQLHAPRRPRAAMDRGEIPPALARSRIAAAARRGADPAVAVSSGLARGRSGQAVRAIFAGAAGAAAGARPGLGPCRLRRATGRRCFRQRPSDGCGWRCCPAAPSGS